MARNTERDTVNRLIETCIDGSRGFRLAADHVTSPGLKRLFEDVSHQREEFATQLEPFAERLGGGEAHDGTTAGKLHRAWMMVKDASTHYDEDSILAEAARGEAAAANTYADAVLGVLPPSARGLVERQYAVILQVQRQLEEFGFASMARN